MTRRPTAAQILSENLRTLMAAHQLSQAELGRRSGVAQTMLSGLLRAEGTRPNPTSGTIDKLASYFKVPAWQLLVPSMTVDLFQNRQLADVIENFAKVPETGRQSIFRIADAEARYAGSVDQRKRVGA